MNEKDVEAITDLLGGLVSQVMLFRKILMRELRNWNDFFAAFKIPPSGGLRSRCIGNLNHYWANYAAIGLTIFTVRILFAPFLFFSFIIIAAFNVYFLLYVGDIQVTPDFTLTGWMKQLTCVGVCFVFLGITRGLEHILWNFIFIVALCGSHMVFRPRSVTAATDSTTELKLHGLNWFGANAGAAPDPENPLTSDEDQYLNSYTGAASNASMRKRH